MASSIGKIELRELALRQQLVAWQKLMLSEQGTRVLSEQRIEEGEVLSPVWEKLRKLYLEDYPIARLRDTSDLIIHANGPNTHGETPQLKAVNWLGRVMRTQFTKLAAAALPVNDDASNHLAQQAQWGITGLVPGSIFMGFALERPKSQQGFEASDTAIFDLIVRAAQSVSIVPQFVEDDGVNSELTEAITDPALRDAAMMAALQLSPTKKSTFDSIEISAPGGGVGTLHLRERTTLKNALIKPMMKKQQHGSFFGELNEIDLDSSRFQLRNISGVGTLRCAMQFTKEHARQLLGHRVRVEGIFDTDTQGRPRLMRVEQISLHSEQLQLPVQ